MHATDWHTLWSNLMHLGTPDTITHPVSLIEKVLRPVVVYLLLVFGLRTFGKRILAQLNPFDFVVLLTISNTVQNAIIGNDTSLLGGALGAATLLSVNAVLVRAFYRGPSKDLMLQSDRDILLINHGHLQEQEMRRLHINAGELTAKAHERGFDSLEDVECATLYPNGTIYFQAKSAMTETARYAELIRRMDLLSTELSALRK
jgi:uncharacterized membrane protein YcaP (DUF421 family)